MFYSHEILSSPEYGVATIWLVATLGSRSITRRVNRKAILDVDVPEACRVIINPQAPMALRLQGSLLYGVSRVYGQQCDYTLLDAEAMRDKLRSTLKSYPGGGLDPSAGKAKPNTLVLPYDPSFLPEANLPGLNMDFLFDFPADGPSQFGTLLAKSPPDTQSSRHSHMSVHLELGSDDIIHGGEVSDGDDGPGSSKRGLFGQGTREDVTRADVGDEQGILLQPDFDFDETGEIVEFDFTNLSPRKRRRVTDGNGNEEWMPTSGQGDAMDLTEDVPVVQVHDDALMDLDIQGALAEDTTHGPVNDTVHAEGHTAQGEDLEPVLQRQTRQRTKVIKRIESDESTTLRNSDLARWNNEYVQNMAIATEQKQQSKQQALTKKNAKYYVFGQGICSVGRGLGALREEHPLKQFSGDALYTIFVPEPKEPTIQTELPIQLDEFSPSTTTQQARQIQLDSIDVEFGRHAPLSILDEHSSQMPWNITVSARSSHHSRIGSISELSARLGETSLGGRLPILKPRPRGRLTSASPLAGRSYLSLDLDEDQGTFADEELEITRYLEGELAEDNEGIQTLSRRASAIQRVAGELDQESLNFFEFIQNRVRDDLREDENGGGVLAFSELLPHASTSAAVVTQGFVNLLTLANKGLLVVKQEAYLEIGEGASQGARYDFGEIFLRL